MENTATNLKLIVMLQSKKTKIAPIKRLSYNLEINAY